MCDKIEHIADFVYIKKDRIWDIMDNEPELFTALP